jgi:hypothetical protein
MPMRLHFCRVEQAGETKEEGALRLKHSIQMFEFYASPNPV